MSTYTNLRNRFDVNWTTLLVGWRGLGIISPWPDRWREFPPLLSADDLAEFASERLELAPDQEEREGSISLLSVNLRDEQREEIIELLLPLADIDHRDVALELRKWRLALLEQTLQDLPEDPIYGLIALTEFWSEFGFPPDSPHEPQGVGNKIGTSDYFRQENLDRMLLRHQEWIKHEADAITVASYGHPAS